MVAVKPWHLMVLCVLVVLAVVVGAIVVAVVQSRKRR
jgi:hypothetical protein